MVSSVNVRLDGEIKEEFAPGPNNSDTTDHVVLYVNSSQRGLLSEKRNGDGFQSMETSNAGRFDLMTFESSWQSRSPSSQSQMLPEKGNGSTQSFTSAAYQKSSRRFHVPFVKKINWASLWEQSKEWIKNPVNMALFAWIVGVGVAGAILFMVMTGMLNHALPKKSQRDTWFEVNNQILNALFTLMCLYQHPKRFHHLALLCRWRAADMLELRKIYCKNGTCKPNERKHMMVVILLLHLNCFAQYALCGLNLGYTRSKRPAIGVGLTISVAISAPAIASVYNILSPLGREYEAQADEESRGQSGSSPSQLQRKSFEKRYSFMEREDGRIPERNPQWMGGLFDFWDDISLPYLSLFCSCCIFGWNMNRLGFGNMYVHIVTFILFCLAPFFIFNLAAVNINNEAVREALGLSGFVLCVFGLLYGGFWRIQMRKRFNLPANDFCCGKPDVTDCFQWLCCYSCSLAQEVRTADYYDIVEEKFYQKEMGDDSTGGGLSRLPPRSGSSLPASNTNSFFQPHMDDSTAESSMQPLRFSGVFASELPSPMVGEVSPGRANNGATKPPLPAVIHKEWLLNTKFGSG